MASRELEASLRLGGIEFVSGIGKWRLDVRIMLLLGLTVAAFTFLHHPALSQLSAPANEVIAAVPEVIQEVLSGSRVGIHRGMERPGGVNAHAVEHLVQLWRTLRTNPRGFDIPDTIEKFGGQKPKTFEAFVREQQDVFKKAA